MRIAVLTGGGDCPGLNACIRAVVLTGHEVYGDETVGFLDGWRGVVDGRSVPLLPERCRDLLTAGGTILGTSRTNPFATDDGPDQVVATLAKEGIDAVVAIGGDDTLGCGPSPGANEVCPAVGGAQDDRQRPVRAPR